MVRETSDRICGKCLKAALPHLVESIKRMRGSATVTCNWISLVRERRLTASASSLDRLLKPIRSTAGKPPSSGTSEAHGTPSASTDLQRLEQTPQTEGHGSGLAATLAKLGPLT